MEITILKAALKDIPLIRQLADDTFRKTYADILSSEQMDYMMEWMYSEDSLKGQIDADGKSFFLAFHDGQPAGYVSFEFETTLDDKRKLYHLQKLYVLQSFQRLGIGSAMLNFVKDTVKTISPDGAVIELNVNRNNPAVFFYEKLGLNRVREGDFPIGNGYYMNDYIYAVEI